MNRKEVPCVHWKDCGGCPLIGFDYKEQLKKKSDKILKASLPRDSKKRNQRHPQADQSFAQTLGYRNKAKWILQPDMKGRLKMGIYQPGTHEVVDIPHCAVHAPEINEFSNFVKTELSRLGVRCGPDLKPNGAPQLRYMIVRYSFRDKKIMAVFVTSAAKVPHLEEVFAGIQEKFGNRVLAVIQNINADSGNVLLGEANRFVRKTGELSETFGRFRVPVGPLSFLQVNSFQASYLYSACASSSETVPLRRDSIFTAAWDSSRCTSLR